MAEMEEGCRMEFRRQEGRVEDSRGSVGQRLSVRQRGSEPGIPRMASWLTRRTALFVERIQKTERQHCTYNEKHERQGEAGNQDTPGYTIRVGH